MARGFILVLDGCGIGEAPDADTFGDVGADTFGHVVEACARGDGDREGLRSGALNIPNLVSLGFTDAAKLATGKSLPGIVYDGAAKGRYAACAEQSFGKDTPSGHWEMAGVPCRFDWGYFHDKENSFPPELLKDFIEQTGVPGILGNCAASGTVIIEDLGEEHRASGKPILYTSADSVMQIAAHEESFGLDRLYEICEIARVLVDKYEIGRVIARPFAGDSPKTFKRTGNRRDYATPPPSLTLLDHLKSAGHEVISIGKIADIFSHQGLTQKFKANGNADLFETTHRVAEEAPDGALIFTNFVDFDQEYGHRRDVPGFAAALEAFDVQLGTFESNLRPGDLVVLTADHGCDPTWPGSDHTREFVPAVFFGPEVIGGSGGKRDTFADIGQTLAAHLGINPLTEGSKIETIA
jgi:phosphopentomutase